MTTSLVTGASGFVGGHLVHRLVEQGDDVVCVLRHSQRAEQQALQLAPARVEWHDGSMESMLDIVERSNADRVFHLASLFLVDHTPADVIALITSNVAFGAMLLEAISAAGKPARFVNVGTAWQHFGGASYDPVNLYAATKQAFADILGYYVSARALQAVTLEIFDTYAPGDPRPKLLNLIARAAQSGEHLGMSPGEQKLDLVHVTDVVDALLAADQALQQGTVASGSVFSVCSAKPRSIRELVAVFESATGLHLDASWGERPYRAREVMEPPKCTPRLPGWEPKISLEEGFKEMNGKR